MHTAFNRLSSTFGFFTTCAALAAGVIALLTVLPFPPITEHPSASISVSKVEVVKGRPHYHSSKREEYAQIRFDLNADLSPLFNWNTKQLFVYVTANYPSSAGGVSEAVIWDAIIPSPQSPYSFDNLKTQYWEPWVNKSKKSKTLKSKKSTKPARVTTDLVKPGLLNLRNQKPKYHITDPSGVLSERNNVTLQVSWNIQPWVGALIWDKGYLGNRVGAWDIGKEGVSEPFNFPPLKGSKPVESSSPAPEAGSAAPATDV
ncbi:Microsomal signal peptidase subunit 3 [Cyphellophora attinorum]|uniref:Signal peptidase subunit 3 n=1 Tax=Cyphellophora attinorum TaxID=1664694 RepID=A0A0N0NNP6_9EURO|nr:Microsomal signal peptidase subunit 3 [Phialophora attinorum]KPI41831.1 Microsomal signal peptidase subunit 3 [Phialophora attinorum]